jgi:Transcription initiation factor IID, 18kD subunit
MFGFGDDRNPSHDTVNVMEEILVEYIADIVGILGTFIRCNNPIYLVPNCPFSHKKVPSINRGLPQSAITTG